MVQWCLLLAQHHYVHIHVTVAPFSSAHENVTSGMSRANCVAQSLPLTLLDLDNNYA